MRARKLAMLMLGVGLTVVLAGLLAFVLMPNASQAADTSQVAANSYTLQGKVYEGSTGLEPPQSTPIQGVTVSLYCSNNQGYKGNFLHSTTTNSDGWYGLDTSKVCEYYNIVETDPAGYTSDGATTVSGTVISANWIEYTYPLAGKTLTGNKFWDRGPATDTPTPTTQPTDTSTPQPTDTPTATSTSSPGPTDTLTATSTSSPGPTDTLTPTPTSPPAATDTPTSTATPTATAGPPGTADLSISKTFSLAEPVVPGSYGYYRLRVENNGPATATNVVITDTLPAEFAFDYGATVCTKIASRPPHDVVQCTLSYVSPGVPTELVLYGTVDSDACGKIVNRAEVRSDIPDPNLHNNDVYLETIVGTCDRPAIAVRKRLVDPQNGPAAPGDIVTFAIEIFNIGDRPLSPILLTDTFDSQHLAYVGASPQPGQLMAVPDHGIIRWHDLTTPAPHGFGHALDPGDHFTVVVRLRAKAAGWGGNCAEVATEIDDISLRDEACDGVDIRRPDIDLVIDKTLIDPAGGSAVVSQTVEFKISLENTGSAPITSLHLQDIYDPAFLSFQWAGVPPDDAADDGVLDWSNVITQFGQPLMPGMTFSFPIRFHANQPTPLNQLTTNCIRAEYSHEQGPTLETPRRCARLGINPEGGPGIVIRKMLYDPPGGVAAPGDIVEFSFVITNTGTTTLTNVALTDLYDINCLHFIPTGWPPSWHLDPDDLTDDGHLDWSNYITVWGSSMPPGGRQQVWPGVQFVAKAGSACDPTINHVEVIATDGAGHQATAQDEEPARITNEAPPRADLGDAPCEVNHAGVGMSAYPAGGPPVVGANFPTVFDPAIGAFGPIHRRAQAGAWLGNAVTVERNADLPPDADGLTNIDPPKDIPDRDGADDGLQMPLVLPHCQPTTFQFTVTVPAGGPQTDYFLNAWFDWNRNGQWGEQMDCGNSMADEWAVHNQVISASASGTYTFTSHAFVPWNPAPYAPLWLRLTLSEQRTAERDGSGPADGYLYGETEDYYLPGLQEVTPTPTATATPRVTFTPTATPRVTPTPTATRISGGYRIYLPLILKRYPVIFYDDFEDGTLAHWTANHGTWTNPGGYMRGEYTLGNAWNIRSSTGGDIVYEGTLNLLSGNAVGLSFRSSADGTSSYDVILDAVAGVFKISKRPPYHMLASYAMTVQRNHPYRIKVIAKGNKIEAYLNGVKRLTTTDATYSSGHLGVILFEATATYDDLQAQELP